MSWQLLRVYSLAPARVLALLAAMMLLVVTSVVDASARRPNIILILSDDVGAETVGVYGGQSYQTPRLDEMANAGVRFDYGHAQPLCTPSRVKIMTGQYNFRNYTHFGYLDPRQTTFAHMLKAGGYNTAVAGKWQLYDNTFEQLQGSKPGDAGFDDYLLWQVKNAQKGSRYWGPLLNRNGQLQQFEHTVFGPDVFNNYVLDYIEAHKSSPFFIYYPMVLAHDPWVTTPDMRDEATSDQQKFAAMMAYMDKLVGKVIDKVIESGLADNTLILFIGDNGTDRDIVSRQHGVDVRGAKGATIDAGTRVPFIAWGPGIVKGGIVSDSLVNLNDILPTLAAVAGVPLPKDYPGDGESLLPVLSGTRELGRKELFIHYEPRWPSGVPARYAFDRRWKLYEGGDFYDMQSDPLESSPLAIGQLDPEAANAYQSLQNVIEGMPGELQSTRRWLPPNFYPMLAGSFLVLLLFAWLIWKIVRRLRR
ncbi:MAG: sulfatase-like hydrolase/transferase [Halioglobus sp.]|nr:sulfatase-like hydrolase/transferase [Halioglobus sp.]